MSTIPDIVPFSETISQTAREGLGVGDQAIARSEMPEIGNSGETNQTVGQDVRMSTMPEGGQSEVQTSEPVVSGSNSKMKSIMSLDAESNRDLKDTYCIGESSNTVPQNLNGSDDILNERKQLNSASATNSVKIELFEASKDSEWFHAIKKKNCKLLLQLFRSDRSQWVQTGLKGRSVLHVAVMQGCSELVGELHKDALVPKDDLVPAGKNWNTPFEFLWENARDGRLKNASAEDIWLVMEGPRPRVATESQVNSPLTRPSLDGPGARYRKSHVQLTMSVDEQLVELREAISAIAIAENFVMDENDVDFNFEKVERKELYVHMACSRLRNVNKEEDWTSSGCDQIVEFIIAVLTDLSEKNLLQKLFDQNDAQGRTILQIFVLCELNVHVRDTWGVKSKCSEKLTSAFGKMLAILPERCVNTLDKAGRTVLHWAVAHHSTWAVDELLRSGKANPAITFSTACYQQITAFNLLLLHEYDLNWYRFPLNNELNRRFGLLSFPGGPLLRREEDPVSWAILMGKKKFVEQVMERQEYKQLYLHKENEFLACAAYSGNVEILQRFLQKDDVDKLNVVSDRFNSPPLHLAVQGRTIMRPFPHPRTFDDWLDCNDFISIKLLEKLLEKDLEKGSAIANTDKTKYGTPNINRNQYSSRQACVNLLLQAGADILTTDKDARMADPGAWAPDEAKIWWCELVAKETLNIKNDLNAAGTGTAVVATLVATASFVGPLQPPLSYVAMSSGTATMDIGVQVTELLIQVFLVTNSLSFYLAITSIMLAIMPSLPIPKEGLVFGPCDDIKRSRRTISMAIGMLLASIISVLISFAVSSFLVIPSHHRKLMAYSTSIGGFICCIGIFFFSLRFLRLICRQNTFIKKLYHWIGKL